MPFNLGKFDVESYYYQEVYEDVVQLMYDADITSRNYPNFEKFLKMLMTNNRITGCDEETYTYSKRVAYENLFLRDRYTIYILGDIMKATNSEKWFCEALSNGDFEKIDCLVRQECVYPVLEYIYAENRWSKKGSKNAIKLDTLVYRVF